MGTKQSNLSSSDIKRREECKKKILILLKFNSK